MHELKHKIVSLAVFRSKSD